MQYHCFSLIFFFLSSVFFITVFIETLGWVWWGDVDATAYKIIEYD